MCTRAVGIVKAMQVGKIEREEKCVCERERQRERDREKRERREREREREKERERETLIDKGKKCSEQRRARKCIKRL